MEKFKDFVYYIGDFLVCILILSLMYFLVAWKLGDAMPASAHMSGNGSVEKQADKSGKDNKIVVKADDKAPVVKKDSELLESIIKGDTNKNTTGTKDEKNTQPGSGGTGTNTNNNSGTKTDSNSGTNTDSSSGTKTNNNSESKTDSAANKDNKASTGGQTSQEKITVTVESGMSAVDIAYMLESSGVVDSADLFVAKLESLGLSGSLLAGTFDLKKGMTYDQIANILTGN